MDHEELHAIAEEVEPTIRQDSSSTEAGILIVMPLSTVMSDVLHPEAVLEANTRLIKAISSADWATYEFALSPLCVDALMSLSSSLTDPALTGFEPEAPGVLIEGKPFHKFFFDNGSLLVFVFSLL